MLWSRGWSPRGAMSSANASAKRRRWRSRASCLRVDRNDPADRHDYRAARAPTRADRRRPLVEEGEAPDCWTKTGAAPTADLSENLPGGLAAAREIAAEFGDQREAPSRRSITAIRPRSKRSVNPVWTWERANRTLALSTASTGRLSPAQGGRPDWIGSLFDGACPTAAPPDTGFAERLRSTYGWVRPVQSSRKLCMKLLHGRRKISVNYWK